MIHVMDSAGPHNQKFKIMGFNSIFGWSMSNLTRQIHRPTTMDIIRMVHGPTSDEPDEHIIGKRDQGCSQPYSPVWARVPLSSFFVSPELSSVRDYVITHSVRSM